MHYYTCICIKVIYDIDLDALVTKEPLYSGARINKDTSWCVIMHYAITNKITYKGIIDLLELIKV